MSSVVDDARQFDRTPMEDARFQGFLLSTSGRDIAGPESRALLEGKGGGEDCVIVA